MGRESRLHKSKQFAASVGFKKPEVLSEKAQRDMQRSRILPLLVLEYLGVEPLKKEPTIYYESNSPEEVKVEV